MRVSQVTALSSSPVYTCARILCEDVAKLKPMLIQRRPDGGRDIVKNHWLARLLKRPNDWQTGFEFRLFLMLQLLLRQNAYAVIIRNAGGRPIKLIPVNSDRVAIWEAPSGDLFYRVTPLGLHERAELDGQPFLIPQEDILHVRGMSLNGLMGSALIVLGKEAIGLALAYEQQAARWMSARAKPSGALTTDKTLTKEAAKRMAAEWRDMQSGLQNVGKVLVLEQGLKYQPIAFSAVEMDFLKSPEFQLEEIARMWRVPLHMLGVAASKGSQGTVEQGASEYLNLTLSGYTTNFGEKFDLAFEIEDELGLELEWDYSVLTRADMTSRVAMHARAIAGGMETQNEARLDLGYNPLPGGDKLWLPSNVAFAGSQASGALPDGGGRPEGSGNKEDIEKQAPRLPSPTRGRRWLREAESDEGSSRSNELRRCSCAAAPSSSASSNHSPLGAPSAPASGPRSLPPGKSLDDRTRAPGPRFPRPLPPRSPRPTAKSRGFSATKKSRWISIRSRPPAGICPTTSATPFCCSPMTRASRRSAASPISRSAARC